VFVNLGDMGRRRNGAQDRPKPPARAWARRDATARASSRATLLLFRYEITDKVTVPNEPLFVRVNPLTDR